MDCTHLKWSKCPVDLTQVCTGKEGYPTLAFQVMVNHAKKIYHCSNAFWGSWNDKTITSQDTFPKQLMDGNVYKEITFETEDEQGKITVWKGCYVIVDGGYHKVFAFMDPMHNRFGVKEMYWSEWMESVRKDVECTFGILKARFRILANGIRFHSQSTVQNIMKSCCTLHNLILQYQDHTLANINWLDIDPDEEEPFYASSESERDNDSDSNNVEENESLW